MSDEEAKVEVQETIELVEKEEGDEVGKFLTDFLKNRIFLNF